jgi:hypothetical protein
MILTQSPGISQTRKRRRTRTIKTLLLRIGSIVASELRSVRHPRTTMTPRQRRKQKRQMSIASVGFSQLLKLTQAEQGLKQKTKRSSKEVSLAPRRSWAAL